MKFLALLAAVSLSGCAGSSSTIREGFAFKMTPAAASAVVHGAIAAHIPPDRLQSAGELSATGTIRQLADKQYFTASAIPLPAQGAFGFEVTHQGTLFSGPAIASQIYRSAVQRASASGERVSVR